jgi:hypothetical protein
MAGTRSGEGAPSRVRVAGIARRKRDGSSLVLAPNWLRAVLTAGNGGFRSSNLHSRSNLTTAKEAPENHPATQFWKHHEASQTATQATRARVYVFVSLASLLPASGFEHHVGRSAGHVPAAILGPAMVGEAFL